MKKKGMFITGLTVVVLAGGFFGYRAYASSQDAAQDEVQTTVVERGSLSTTLGSSGNTRAGQSAILTWQTSGQVGEMNLQAGDLVAEDQVLAALDPDTYSTEMIQARQDLIDAQQALYDLLNSTLQQAQALQALEDAQQTLASLKQDAAETTSQAQLALAEAQEAYDDAVKNRTKMNYPHSSNKLVIEKAETDYLLAKATYKDALQEYRKYEKKKLTNPDRVRALNNLVSAEQAMDTKFATYNWYLLSWTDNDIAQADAELAVAQANLDAAQAEWDRVKDGASDAAVAMAEAQLTEAERAWEQVKDGASDEDIAAAQAAVDAAQAYLDRAELLAPFSGTLTEVDIATGDLVSAGDSAFRIDDLSALYIDLQVSEVDLADLAIGQPATLEFDAIADREYSGEVTQIGMVGTVSQGVVTYPVTVRVTDADEHILPGMTASVSITTNQVEDVLLVPNKAIRTSSGQKSVIVLFEGQQVSVPVTVGLVGSSMSEVSSPQLREGDTVVINGTTTTTTTTSTTRDNMQGGGFGMPDGLGGGPPPGGMP